MRIVTGVPAGLAPTPKVAPDYQWVESASGDWYLCEQRHIPPDPHLYPDGVVRYGVTGYAVDRRAVDLGGIPVHRRLAEFYARLGAHFKAMDIDDPAPEAVFEHLLELVDVDPDECMRAWLLPFIREVGPLEDRRVAFLPKAAAKEQDGEFTVASGQPYDGEPYTLWKTTIQQMGGLVDLWEAIKGGQRKELEGRLSWFPKRQRTKPGQRPTAPPREPETALYWHPPNPWRFRQTVGMQKIADGTTQPDRYEDFHRLWHSGEGGPFQVAWRVIMEAIGKELHGVLSIYPPLDRRRWNTGARGLHTLLRTGNLRQLAYLQLLYEVLGIEEYLQCQTCHRWNRATGRRSTYAGYCGDACRQRKSRAKRPARPKAAPQYERICALDGCIAALPGPGQQRYCCPGHRQKAHRLRERALAGS